MLRIGASSHGESRLRILRIVRRGDRHDARDLTVSVRLEGHHDAAFRDGRPDGVMPGEALKNLVHAAAREHAKEELELFGLSLCARVLAASPRTARARVEIAERPWSRMESGGKPRGQAFVAAGPELRTVAVTSNGTQTAVVAGIEELSIMRTSGFAPPLHASDDGTDDGLAPLVVGSLTARWTYGSADVTFGPYRAAVRAAIVDTLAMHAAKSTHHTLYSIADVVLNSFEEISDVYLAMHERPYRPADLFRDNVENPDELFVAAEEPIGVVELTVERSRS